MLFALASATSGAPVLLTLALLLSAVGDLALSRSGQKAFLAGLTGFALAHLLFIILFQGLGPDPIWAAFGHTPFFAVVLVLVALSSEIWLAPYTGKLVWPVRVYVTLITLALLPPP